jgi:acetyl-CoA carboxylase carboxyl transferase subunit beta
VIARWKCSSPDLIIPERPDAADEPQQFCERVGAALHRELTDLIGQDADMRRIARGKRFSRIGSETSRQSTGI